jgi:hypothetical protein
MRGCVQRVTAGLFIGEGKNAAKYPKTMGRQHHGGCTAMPS